MSRRHRHHRANGQTPAPAALPPPHSVEAEQAVLGALLLDARAWRAIEGQLSGSDFHRPDHRLIFEAIAVLAAAGATWDVLAVCEQLRGSGDLEDAGGADYVRMLELDTASAASIAAYAKVVRERAALRELQKLAGDIERGIADRQNLDEVLLRAESSIVRLRGRAGLPQRLAEPLSIESVAAWAQREAPSPRDWIIEGLIPAGRVSSLLGNGGLGKTIIASQIAVHVSIGRDLFGRKVQGGPVLGIFCEDEQDEIERRIRAACAGEALDLADIDQLLPLSREGMDNILCTFERDRMQLTPFYAELEATIARHEPRLVILDTAADLYAGDFMSTPQVRQFIKTALGGLCVRHGCAVLLIAHPSATGMSSGDGGGYSVAWSNSVRSRLYLRRPESEQDPDENRDRRVLEVRKSNYAADGVSIGLLYRNGYFVPEEPPEEMSGTRHSASTSRLTLAVMDYMRERVAGGSVVGFGALFAALHGRNQLGNGQPETLRKRLQRALRELVAEGLLKDSQMPRGYRCVVPGHGEIVPGIVPTRDTEAARDNGTLGTPSYGGGVPCPEYPVPDCPGQGSVLSRESESASTAPPDGEAP